MVKERLAPGATATAPLGLMVPPVPALALIVQRPIVHAALLTSVPTLPAASCACTRNSAFVLLVPLTIQLRLPEFGTPLASVSHELPPLRESWTSTEVTAALSVAVHCTLTVAPGLK